MKKLIALIVCMVFLCLPVSTIAGGCEQYGNELVGQCFETTLDDIKYTICFGDSVYGPCPSGIAILSYSLIQVIDGIEYVATIEIDCDYNTTSTLVIIGGIEFVLAGNRLIMLPDEPLILDGIVEEQSGNK